MAYALTAEAQEKLKRKQRFNQILDCKWIYLYKYDKHARLVVRGDQQLKAAIGNTYAATLVVHSFRTLIAMAAPSCFNTTP